MYQLLQRLAGRYRITLLSFLETDDEREFLADLEPLCQKVIAMRRSPPWRWQMFPYEPFDEFRTPQMEEALHDCLEHEDFDLIQLEYTQMACYGSKELRVPTILTKHEVDFAACLRRAKNERGFLSKTRWFYNYLQVLDREIRLLDRVDAAVCMTETDRRELAKFPRPVPVHVISTGVDLDYFKPPAVPPDSQRLVFVGYFRHHPNVDAMVYFCRQILPRVREQIPAVELCIVGSHPPQQLASLAAIPGVEVTGFVPDIRPFMETGAVYIVPLRLGVGIRGKILEAWGMAMPVVATSVAAAGLQVENGRNIMIADSEEGFADHVVALLKDPGLRRRLGAAGRTVAEQHYGWDTAVDKLDRLYRSYLHPQGPGEPVRSGPAESETASRQ
jgi:glycosyltransferase involved in cell wall biosynthesis